MELCKSTEGVGSPGESAALICLPIEEADSRWIWYLSCLCNPDPMLCGLLTLTAHPQLRPTLLGCCETWEGDKLPEHLPWKRRKSHSSGRPHGPRSPGITT